MGIMAVSANKASRNWSCPLPKESGCGGTDKPPLPSTSMQPHANLLGAVPESLLRRAFLTGWESAGSPVQGCVLG